MRDYTVIYSSASKEAFEELMKEILLLFESPLKLKDMFYYDVFCKTETYAHYNMWEEAPVDMIIPSQLTNPCSKPKDRVDYVNNIIELILKGEMEKPEWMVFVEMEEYKTEYNLSPSTFLYLYAKDEKYKLFGEKLINFLYSPNLLITMIK